MRKAYYFLWHRAGIDRNEFMEYYENTHLDLIIDKVPKHDDFRRSYPAWDRSSTPLQGLKPFDAITAITYEKRATFEEAVAIVYSQPFNKIIIEDELRFLNRSRMRFVVVDEVIARGPQDKWQPAPVVADGAKLVRLIRRPSGLDVADFRKTYETLHAPVVLSAATNCIDYRCNYVCGSDSYNFTTPELLDEHSHHWMTSCDLIEELCFSSNADAEAATRALGRVSVHSTLLMGMLDTPAIICDQRLRT